ncbi:helix-turn-helix domain-containing protein [Enterovibrio sp. ZSDZ42]|uniref:Helix-turn-helix domain-containing protein n=1 Tax=Enterovibrio gelatinilyticus TaxID=2899819 RepID=A0ABT5QYD0_9GAMM|nr:helix-turn-helix transcriptional regulator [Enterovibrio sp. ZSDZ42]MDD1792536.1 helix-turn-helix domain-containing protein [Enterovibrio sp. ZSDZ42]
MGKIRKKDPLLIWLGAVRMEKGLSQQQVAEQIDGLSVRTLQRWEQGDGNPRLDQIRAVMQLYGVSGLDTSIGELKFRRVLTDDVRAAISKLPERFRRPILDLVIAIVQEANGK